jgi:hypothetical protein
LSSRTSVLINGVSHTVSSNGATATAAVDASEIANVGDLDVTAVNPTPGGGTSGSIKLHVIAAGNRLRTLNYPTNDIVHDEVNHLLYASVSSSSTTSPNSIIAIDPVQGVVVATQAMTGQPIKLAIADDASYLYVSLPATGEISRLRLPSLTPDIQWSLKNSSGAGFSATDIAVAPGQPHTLAVTGSSLNIYDDSTRRTLTPATGYPLPTFDTITWGSDASTIYATSAVTSGGPEYVLSVDQNGATLVKTINSVLGDFAKQLVYDRTTNHLYDGSGRVADPSTGTPVGQMNFRNFIGYGQNPFAIDSAHNKAFFLNVNYFTPATSVDIQAFDLGSFTFINAVAPSDLSGSRVVPWGASGLAVGGGTKIFLIDGSFVSSSGISSQTGGYIGVSPSLDTISPQTTTAGSDDVSVTLTGKDFAQSAVVTWNGQTLPISTQTATQMVLTLSASMLTQPIAMPITVSNGPGTESSGGISFAVLPSLGPNTQISALSISGLDMAWDATRGRLYVAVPDTTSQTGDSIAVVDPATTTLTNTFHTGGRPSSLGPSDDGHYLYTGFQTTNFVRRYTLPDFALDLTIPLNSGSNLLSHAEDVKVAPGHPNTVAVTMGNVGITARGAGGLAIFDDAVQRPAALLLTGDDTYKLAWGKDSTQLFAHSDPNISSQTLYVFSVDGNGVTRRAASGFGLTNLGLRPHYDAVTNLVYGDGGRVSNPTDASAAGVFQARGLIVPDSKLNRAFILRGDVNVYGTTIYRLDIFDLGRQTLLKSISIPGVTGYPTQLLRWGDQGLAFLTYAQGYSNTNGILYILQGSDITGLSTPPAGSATLTPSSVVAGVSASAIITVSGSGFQPTSTVLVNGSARPTTYVSSTQLSFQLTVADQTFANYLTVVVTDPATGISTPATSLPVNNPIPVVSSLSSPKVLITGGDTKITLSGTNFVPTTKVLFNGKARATTYVNPNQVSVLLPDPDLEVAGNCSLTAVNPLPGGGAAPVTLEVDNPLPSITGVYPSTFVTGSPSRTAQVNGSGFFSGTVIQVGGTPHPTTYSASSLVTVSLSASDLASPGGVSIIAVNPAPGGGSSAAASIAVNNGLPGPITLVPNSVTQGASSPKTVTVNGSNFASNAYVLVGNVAHATTYVSSTQLTFDLTVAEQANTGSKVVTVVNPPPSGGSSSALLGVVAATPTPVISSVYPTQFVTGSTNTLISVAGSGINSTSVLRWNGDPLVTYAGTNNLSAMVPASLLTSPGTATITVDTATSTPSLSNAVSVSIVYPPAPTLTSMYPTNGPIKTGFTATLTGTNFAANSAITINGVAVPTTFASTTQLTADVPATMIGPGNSIFAVTTPAPRGGTSSSLAYTAYIPIANNAMVYNPVDQLFYLSVPASAGAPYGNSIVSLDPLTGALGIPILVGSEPYHMVLTSDSKALWVGLDGANAVRKVDLVAHTAGLQFALPPSTSNVFGAALKAIALAAIPGQSDSVIVSAYNNQTYGSLFAIYDNGVARGTTSYFNPQSIAINTSTNELYLGNGSAYQTYLYGPFGLAPHGTGSPDGNVANYNTDDRLQLNAGRIYTEYGKAIDPETAQTIGSFVPSTSSPLTTAIDPALGRAFVLMNTRQYFTVPNTIQVFNLSDFRQVGSSSIPVNVATRDSLYPVGDYVSRLTRWGTNGLAFRTRTIVYALRSDLVKDFTATPADLGVTLNVSGATTTGSQTVYTTTVTNAGPQLASEIALNALAPSTGLLVSATSTAGSCSVAANATCNLGTLASGATATIVFTINQLTPGSSTLTAQVTASQSDPDSTNNQAASTATITGAVYTSAPTVSSVSPSAILAGSDDTVITVTGSGFGASSAIMLDGGALSTTVTGTSTLSAVVPASSISTMGWRAITVSNPAPGGGLSSVLPLTIYSAIKIGANRMIYDPFSRKIFATVGSAQTSGNSLVGLTPETGDMDAPVLIGSEPTFMDLSDDGNILYVLASGDDQVVRYNMLTRQPEFSYKIQPNYGTGTGAPVFSIQPGSEDTIAINTPFWGPAGTIVDFDKVSRQVTTRPSTLSTANAGGEMHFLDSSTLIFESSLSRYTVTPSGIGSLISSIPIDGSAFKLAKGVAYSSSGNIVDVTALPSKKLGTLAVTPPYYGSQADSVAPDLAIGRVFLTASQDGGTYNVLGGSGVVAFDTTTLLPTGYTPFAVDSSVSPPITGVDLFRWGQDGIATLNSTGTIYLMRGPAVVPQLLGTSTPPALAGAPTLQHGAGNTVVTLSGSNFLPGVAAHWNGSYRTTKLIDSTHIAIDVTYNDLLSPGSAIITCSNPGSSTSAPITINVN